MENTLPTSNIFKILLVGLFLLFLCGVLGYLTIRQFSDRAGEFPRIEAQDLRPSSATLVLNGTTNSLDTNGSSYDILLDTKGEVVSSVNLDFAFPSKDLDVAVDKGNIIAFENGVFTSKVDTANQKLKLQFGTADGRTFTGSGVLARLILKRGANPTSTKSEIKLLDSSYIKLAGYAAKAFATNNISKYSFELGPLSQNIIVTSSVSTAQVSQVVSSNATSTTISTTTSNAIAVASSSSNSVVQTVVSSTPAAQSSATTTAIVTSATTSLALSSLVSSTTSSLSMTTSKSSVNTNTSNISKSSSVYLPATAVIDSRDSNLYLYIFFTTFGIGMTLVVKSRKKIDFERKMQE